MNLTITKSDIKELYFYIYEFQGRHDMPLTYDKFIELAQSNTFCQRTLTKLKQSNIGLAVITSIRYPFGYASLCTFRAEFKDLCLSARFVIAKQAITEAAAKFDETAGISFATFAEPFIYQALDQAINNYNPDTTPIDQLYVIDPALEYVLKGMTERECYIVKSALGIGVPEVELKEIAYKLGVTQERARQILQIQIRRLATNNYETTLKPTIDKFRVPGWERGKMGKTGKEWLDHPGRWFENNFRHNTEDGDSMTKEQNEEYDRLVLSGKKKEADDYCYKCGVENETPEYKEYKEYCRARVAGGW